MTTRRQLLAGLLCMAWLLPGSVNSQTPDVMRGMDSLKRSSEAMKGHPEGTTLEVQTTTAAAWRKLKPGMTEKEVTDVLGKPDRVEAGQQSFRWYWEKTAPKGWVGFGNESRKVTEWRNL